jgi:hypothetical protein
LFSNKQHGFQLSGLTIRIPQSQVYPKNFIAVNIRKLNFYQKRPTIGRIFIGKDLQIKRYTQINFLVGLGLHIPSEVLTRQFCVDHIILIAPIHIAKEAEKNKARNFPSSAPYCWI